MDWFSYKFQGIKHICILREKLLDAYDILGLSFCRILTCWEAHLRVERQVIIHNHVGQGLWIDTFKILPLSGNIALQISLSY
jgi:hypothetical protein